ncbi:hypothetical protein CN288_12520 [Bacillus sp. AFS023182]|uniref:YopX family protein n=1 Tax=Bacillus sp. AFS023182 TaxID=2033492 RepID=UPI000BF57B8E|nr:YopX family protein [Bacillus sp. AFS023182]PFE03795.1 hypothetical protein CN288_12520 [Bacillus sp. AFS023182]
MREIKFRAWVLRDWALDGLMENMMEYDVESFHDPLYEYKQGNIILMQYTGLKDKKNVPIYEGDIVQISGHPFQGSIDIDGNYEVGYNELMELCCGGWYLHRMRHWAEVIGNIYENPKLLEESK